MNRRLYALALACLLCTAFAADAFETQLEHIFTDAPASREAELTRRLEQLEADSIQLRVTPTVYLDAPEALGVELPPEGQFASEAALGVRGQLPFGATADLSWNQRVERLQEVVDFEGTVRTGFVHTASVQADVTLPVFVLGVAFPVFSLSQNIRQQARVNREDARNELARQFVTDWFSLYREHIVVEALFEHVLFARRVVEAYEIRTEQGDVPLVELWRAQQELGSRELQHVQADSERRRNLDLFLFAYGVPFAEDPRIPEGDIVWSRYGVVPRADIEAQRSVLSQHALELRYQVERIEQSPRITVSTQLSGPVPTQPGTFGSSFTGQFETFDDWTPTLGVGVAISTTGLRAGSIERSRNELELARLALRQQQRDHELEAQLHHLERLRAQYQSTFDRDAAIVARMREHVRDLELRHAGGEIDLLQLLEAQVQLSDMQASLRGTESRIREVHFLIQLWGRL